MANIQYINNSFIGYSIIKIVSVPHISLLNENFEQPGIAESCLLNLKSSMKSLFDAVSSLWSGIMTEEKGFSDTNIEFRWESKAVSGQTFKAEIFLYIIIRQRNNSQESCKRHLDALTTIFKTHFRTLKYEIDVDDVTTLDIYQKLKKDNCKLIALRKKEDVITLQQITYPYCYFYEKIELTTQDLRHIIFVLSQNPDACVSISLNPIRPDNYEYQVLAQNSYILSNMSKGLQEYNQHIVVSNAERPSQIFNYYNDNKNGSLFFFSIYTIVERDKSSLLSSTLASQFKSGTSNLQCIDLSCELPKLNKSDIDYYLPWFVFSCLLTPPYRSQSFSRLRRLPFIITSEEASEIAYFPFGTRETSAGLNVNETIYITRKIRKDLVCTENEETDNDLIIGKLKSGDKNTYIKMPLGDMAKHMFIAGTPGMGKSEFSTSLVHRLYKKGIPFLVIEPAKNEYRALCAVIPELQVFTPGKDHISPFRANLFLPPENVVLSSYKSTLKTFFEAASSTSETLGTLYADTLDYAYGKFGWLDHYTIENAVTNGAQIFNLSDFIKCYDEVFEKRGYSAKQKDLCVAGKIRLSKLLRYFDSYNSVPISDILKYPTVIELNGIENELEKAIIICYLLLMILSYVNSNYIGNGVFKQCIIIEEAHVLLDCNRPSIEGQVDPTSVAKNLILRMLKELRSVGIGFVIADQSPSAVGLDVVAMTGTKIAFNIVEQHDRQILSDSMGLSTTQFERLGRFIPGEAFYRSSIMSYAEEVRTLLYRETHNIPISISDRTLMELSTYWKNPEHASMLKPYPECHYNITCLRSGTCDFKICAIAGQIARLIYSETSTIKDKAAFNSLIQSINDSNKYIQSFTKGQRLMGLKRCVKIHLSRLCYFNSTLFFKREELIKFINKVTPIK